MKVMKNRILYFLILFPFFLASSVTLHFVAPHLLSLFPEVNWLALALALLVILTPWGSIELSSSKSDQQPLAFKLWLFKILLLEIALMLIYFGFTQFNNVILPIHTTAHPTEFVSSLSTLLLHFGLYPWGLIGIFAISFGISSYIKNQDSYMCTIIQKEVNTKHEGLKSIFNTIPTIFTLVGFALTMVIITVIAAALLTPSHELKQITGFTSVAMVASLLMLLLAVRKKTSHLLVIAYKQRPAVGFIITLMIWTIVLAIIAVVAGHLFHDKPHTPAFVQSIFNKGWANYWQLFSSIWWMLFVPVTAVFIARFSYGYTLRSILLAVLALPALLAIGLFSAAHFHYHLHVHTPARIAELAAIVGFVLLISLIARKRYFPMVCLIYLPKSKHIKKRNSETFHFRIKQTASIFFYFFLPAGIFVTTLFSSFIILPAIWITLAVCIRFLMLLFRFRRATDL